MKVTESMLKIRNSFVCSDRQEAMKAMTRFCYYIVATCATTVIFRLDEEIGDFCTIYKLDRRALEWLIDRMRREGLIDRCEMPVVLTPLGFEKLCMSE